jgi:signal transduction histidine kinase
MQKIMNLMERLPLNNKLLIGIFGGFLVTLLVGLNSIYSTRLLSDTAKATYKHDLQAVSNIKDAEINLLNVSASLRAMTLTTKPADRDAARKKLVNARSSYNRKINDIRVTDKLNEKVTEEMVKQLEDISVLVSQYFSRVTSIVALLDNNDSKSNAEAINQINDSEFIKTRSLAADGLTELANVHEEIVKQAAAKSEQISEKTQLFTLILLVIGLSGSIGFGLLVSLSIRRPMDNLTASVENLAAGRLGITVPHTDYTNEVGVMAKSIQVLQQGAKVLEIQHWVKNHASAIFAEMQQANNMVELAQRFLSQICPLLNAGQAALYFYDSTEKQLRLLASYGYRDSNLALQQIATGETLIGQCVHERVPIILSNLPENYMRISSSLGVAVPKYAAILPIIHADCVNGVLEVASFHEFGDRENSLMKQVLPMLSMRMEIIEQNIRTEHLLVESQDQAKHLEIQAARLEKQQLEMEAQQIGLIQSEKMAALGHLIAGIAHEINTPLGAISSSATNIQKFLAQTLTIMPPLFQSFSVQEMENFLSILDKSLGSSNALSAKEQRQKRRALAEQLGDDISDADVIADTLVDMGIYDDIAGIVELLKKANGHEVLELAYKLSELKKGIQTINTATDRAAKVVFALKSYVHQDNSTEKLQADVTQGIDTVLTLYHNQIKHNIELIKNYAESLPQIYCYPDELNQVWTNLIHNALQAMDNKGTLAISVAQTGEHIKVTIQDNGAGISPENKAKIFDAFFTTKAAGEGGGLGLHIVKQIIDKHSGSIDVESQSGCTVFTVLLPISPVAGV